MSGLMHGATDVPVDRFVAARAARGTTIARVLGWVLVTGAAVALSGCAGIEPVQPWEKGVLAKPAMTFDDDRLDAAFQEHTYGSKEAASGGAGVGGGGCGCN